MASTALGYTTVDAPAATPTKGGILDRATVIQLPAGSHETMGVQYESDACFDTNFVGDVASCMRTATKLFGGIGTEDGDPFFIYAGVECFLLTSEDFEAKAAKRLDQGRSRGIEKELWDRTFPTRAVNLTPAGAVGVQAGLGLLEEYAGRNYTSTPMLHVGKRAVSSLAAKQLLWNDLDGLSTVGGSTVVSGAGYFGATGPDGADVGSVGDVATATQAWMYITGQVTLRLSASLTYRAIAPQTNKQLALAEQVIVPTVDCLVAAVLVTLE